MNIRPGRSHMERKVGKDMEPADHKSDQYPTSDEIVKEELTEQPGKEYKMETEPLFEDISVKGYGRLKDKVAIITGGDSGIGRAVVIAYAKEGARIVLVYKEETRDAEETAEIARSYGTKCLLIKGNLQKSDFAKDIVEKTLETYGSIDILVNNAAEQHPKDSLTEISDEQIQNTFATNVFGMMYLTREVIPHLKEGASIINTTSITAFRGNKTLIDYSSTKGAVASFTRALAENLGDKKIRVNQVAPGPIWTPLIPSTFSGKELEEFGEGSLLGRPGQPVELAEAYVFLAWDYASSYMTGQTLHINGGDIING